jgi:molybdopterin-guanine dinucleotide biosynthesis protein A
MNFSAVILAGGKSSRMGRDKAFLEIGGETLLAGQIKIVRAAGAAEIFISGRAEIDYCRFGQKVLLDKFSAAGPLAGVERALAAANWPRVLVLAVDLPAMDADFLSALAGNGADNLGAIPRVAGNLEPLAAFYPKAALPLVESLLEAGENSVANFARHCVQSGLARFVDLADDQAFRFANWNAPTFSE